MAWPKHAAKRGGEAVKTIYGNDHFRRITKGGLPWEYRYGTDEEREAFLEERRRLKREVSE